MFNFTFPWTKRREARKAAEQKARDDAAWRAIIDARMGAEDRRRLDAQRARASTIEPPRRAGLASVPFDGYTAQGDVFTGTLESVTAPPACGGGTFDGGGASGDWSRSACSSSGSDSSSGSSDSGNSCSSD
ncbi:hypothetical protein AKG95_18005 [Janthinobacterium lividum]|uniref:Uncharacterized protein n=1 Tax=Janthinobacterium lividum TaxID=29581 RepID=A0A1S1U835_9BURK|nr:hypothetical protein [Janthinobacterium lividum]OHV96607.1 hypothetical protein AKG95_18005 [Janthinobacterium lividum]